MRPKYEEAIKFFTMKRWDSALQSFLEVDTSVFSVEEKAEYSYYIGLCYTKLERFNDAVLYLEQVVTGESGNLRICQCRLTLAYIYLSTRRYKMAEFELDRLIKVGVKSAQIYTMFGYASWCQKLNEDAINYYEKALELEATNATALNGLGYVLVETGKDTPRGLELCKKAVESRPTSAAYLDSLGWAYFKTGEISEARSYLRRALDLAPRHKEISNHMKAVVGGEAS